MKITFSNEPRRIEPSYFILCTTLSAERVEALKVDGRVDAQNSGFTSVTDSEVACALGGVGINTRAAVYASMLSSDPAPGLLIVTDAVTGEPDPAPVRYGAAAGLADAIIDALDGAGRSTGRPEVWVHVFVEHNSEDVCIAAFRGRI